MDPLRIATLALERATALCAILDRQHTVEALHGDFRAVRQEIIAALVALAQFAEPVTANTPGAVRADSPDTSRQAARAVSTRSGSQRHRILKCLADCGPMTDSELQDTLSMIGSSQRTRRNELCAAGFVRAATQDGNPLVRARDLTGLDQQVWEVTDRGRAALGKLNGGQHVMMFPGDRPPCRVCGFPVGDQYGADSESSYHPDTAVCQRNLADAQRAAVAV